MKFVNVSGVPANFVAPGDYSFWSLLNEVIQEEPAKAPTRRPGALSRRSASSRASRSTPTPG